MSSLEQLLEQAQSEVADSTDATVLNDLRVKYLGRKGALTAHLKSLGKMPAEQRAAAGKQINQIKLRKKMMNYQICQFRMFL